MQYVPNLIRVCKDTIQESFVIALRDLSPSDKEQVGIAALVAMLRFHQVPADPAQVAHAFSGNEPTADGMIRYLRGAGLRARMVGGSSKRLSTPPPRFQRSH